MSDTKPVINIDDVQLRETSHGNRFAAQVGSFGGQIGCEQMGAMLHLVEPGKKAFPFHVHHVTEELFIILDGQGTYRFGDKEYPIRKGDVLSAPCGGPEHAHQIINSGSKPLQYLGISANPGKTDVVEYPDSGKFAVSSRRDRASGEGGVRHIGRSGDSLDYWDGEDNGDDQ
jgi:uncharacterized cupin superfamily protein